MFTKFKRSSPVAKGTYSINFRQSLSYTTPSTKKKNRIKIAQAMYFKYIKIIAILILKVRN